MNVRKKGIGRLSSRKLAVAIANYAGACTLRFLRVFAGKFGLARVNPTLSGLSMAGQGWANKWGKKDNGINREIRTTQAREITVNHG